MTIVPSAITVSDSAAGPRLAAMDLYVRSLRLPFRCRHLTLLERCPSCSQVSRLFERGEQFRWIRVLALLSVSLFVHGGSFVASRTRALAQQDV